MIGPLLAHVRPRQTVQLLVNPRHELIGRAHPAVAPGSQQMRDFVLWERFHPIAFGDVRDAPEDTKF